MYVTIFIGLKWCTFERLRAHGNPIYTSWYIMGKFGCVLLLLLLLCDDVCCGPH